MSDEDETYRIYGSMGELTLEVEGSNETWVEEMFEASWTQRLDELCEMNDAIREADIGTQ